jgi:hypothetical protein
VYESPGPNPVPGEVQVAFPVVVLTLTGLQSSSPFSVNVTVPPPGTGDTVAVKVTGERNGDGFAEDCNVVVVGIKPFTTWVRSP